MKKTYSGKVLFFLFLFATCIVRSQNVGINVTGANPSINAILDLNTGNSNNFGLIIPNVSLTALGTFNPPIANAATAGDVGMMVYNTNAAVGSGVGYYYWNGAAWVSVSGGGAVTAANDGTSLNGTTVILGGAFNSLLGQLTQNTEIPFNGKNLTFSTGGGGGGKLGINLPVNTSALQALEIGGNGNTIRVDGLSTAGTTYNQATANKGDLVFANDANGDLWSLKAPSVASILTSSAAGVLSWQTGTPLSGSGTINYLARWTPNATTLGIGITQDNGTEVGIQTGVYAFPGGNPLLLVTANASNANAISGVTTIASSYGVRGSNSANTGTSTGVQGFIGGALNVIPVPAGIYGSTATASTYAILGSNSQTGGLSVGVGGYLGAFVNPPYAAGVYGNTTTNSTYGVIGYNTSGSNAGGSGVYGYNPFPGTGVLGLNNPVTTFGFFKPANGMGGNFFGEYGGVVGSYNMTGVIGTGVLGLGYNNAGPTDPNSTYQYDFGVAGNIGGSAHGSNPGAGVAGFVGPTTNTPNYYGGVMGGSNSTDYGVIGFNTSNTGYGVAAFNTLGVNDPALLVSGYSNTYGVAYHGRPAINNGSITFYNNGNNNTVSINSGITTATYAMTLPTTQGAANTVLTNNGAGILSWGTLGSLNNIQVITASGNYTPTAGTTKAVVVLIGGGGGGGGCNPNTNANFAACAGGGGAGGHCVAFINNVAGPYACTVGAGGAAGSNAPGNGGVGGTTTLINGITYTANGGNGGGLCANNNGVQGAGGAGGTAVNGLINTQGASGGSGQFFYVAGTGFCQAGSGFGASTEFGSGGVAPVSRANAPGIAGAGFGSGGSGGMGVANPGAVGGGAGAPGVIIVYEYK